MWKDDINLHVFQNRNLGTSIGNILSEKKKYGGTGLVSEKTKALFAELN